MAIADLIQTLTSAEAMQTLVRVISFVVLGMFFKWLSDRFPMPAYVNRPLTMADLAYILAALVTAAMVESLLNPWLLQALYQMAGLERALLAWTSQASTLELIFVYLVFTDFAGYLVHRFMHLPWVWRIHAFHHASHSLNWVTGARGSPLHVVLIQLPGTLIASLLLLPHNITAFTVVMLIEIGSQHLNHSNLRLPFARQFEWVLVTPQMHFLHHDEWADHGKCNYGFYFSFWDRVFGTYVDASTMANKGKLGLKENYEESAMFWGYQLKERANNTDQREKR